MKFSVIIPSYLGEYKTASKDRDMKLLRAVNSVLNQTYEDYEILVIADNCKKTVDIIKKSYFKSRYNIEGRIRGLYLEGEHKLFSGIPRNTGIAKAKGEWITYLDIDDVYKPNHLKELSGQVNGSDWVWFDDVAYNRVKDEFYIRQCNINKINQCGTSNIAHKRELKVEWATKNIYGFDDWIFIKRLKKISNNYKFINAPGYIVCHIPGKNSYDL